MTCQWSLDLIVKAKLKLESRNWKIQYGCQAAILKVTSLKIKMLLPIATKHMHMKFEIEIPKQTWVTLRKPCRLQTDGRTRWIQSSIPRTNFVGRGHKYAFGVVVLYFVVGISTVLTSSNGSTFRVAVLYAGNSPVTGQFPSQRPVTRSFGVYF